MTRWSYCPPPAMLWYFPGATRKIVHMYIISRRNLFCFFFFPLFSLFRLLLRLLPSPPPPHLFPPSFLRVRRRNSISAQYCVRLAWLRRRGPLFFPFSLPLVLRNYTKDQLFKQNAIWWRRRRWLGRSLGRPRTSRLFGGHTNAHKKKFRSAPRVFSFSSGKRREKVDDQILRPKNFRDFLRAGSSKDKREKQWQLFNPLCPPPHPPPLSFLGPFYPSFFLLSSVVRSASEILFHAHWSPSSFISGPPPSLLGMMAPKDEGGREGGKGKKGFVHFPPSSSNPPSPLLLFLLLPSPFWCCSHEDDDGGGGPLFLLSPALLSGISSVSAKPRKRIELADGEGGEGRKMGKGLSRMSREEGAEKGGKKRKKERGWGRKRKGFSKKEGESISTEKGGKSHQCREREGGEETTNAQG